jgi:hypothetical protein
MPRLGRLVEHDPRSRAFAFTPETTALPAHSVTHPRRVPIFNQDLHGPDRRGLGDCTANAGIGWAGTDPHHRAVSEADVVPFYSEVTASDEFDGQWPPDDTGSSGLAVAKALKRRGWITRYEHAFTFQAALAAIATAPVIVGVPWYSGMFTPDEHGYVTISGDYLNEGHEFLIRGIDPRKQHVLCDNSWGYEWGGHRGRFWLRFATLERLLGEDGDCTVLHR